MVFGAARLSQFASSLLPLLEILANAEEASVREKVQRSTNIDYPHPVQAVDSIRTVLQILPNSSEETHGIVSRYPKSLAVTQ